jgi:hypothetical protein
LGVETRDMLCHSLVGSLVSLVHEAVSYIAELSIVSDRCKSSSVETGKRTVTQTSWIVGVALRSYMWKLCIVGLVVNRTYSRMLKLEHGDKE